MARKQYEQFCLRFSMENPTHVKLFRIINNLDSDIYRSKNQFIMEALEAYVSGKSIDELCKKEKQEEEAPLTKQDLLEFGSAAPTVRTAAIIIATALLKIFLFIRCSSLSEIFSVRIIFPTIHQRL